MDVEDEVAHLTKPTLSPNDKNSSSQIKILIILSSLEGPNAKNIKFYLLSNHGSGA